MKKQIARQLRKLATRLDPQTEQPLRFYTTSGFTSNPVTVRWPPSAR